MATKIPFPLLKIFDNSPQEEDRFEAGLVIWATGPFRDEGRFETLILAKIGPFRQGARFKETSL